MTEHSDWCDANGCRCGKCPCSCAPITEQTSTVVLVGRVELEGLRAENKRLRHEALALIAVIEETCQPHSLLHDAAQRAKVAFTDQEDTDD